MSNWFRRCMIRCIMSSFPATRETKKHGMFRWKLSGSTAATTTISSELFYGLGTSISWVNIRGTLIDCSRLALLFAYNWIYWPLFYVLVIGFWTPSLPMIWQPKFLHFFPPPMASQCISHPPADFLGLCYVDATQGLNAPPFPSPAWRILLYLHFVVSAKFWTSPFELLWCQFGLQWWLNLSNILREVIGVEFVQRCIMIIIWAMMLPLCKLDKELSQQCTIDILPEICRQPTWAGLRN